MIRGRGKAQEVPQGGQAEAVFQLCGGWLNTGKLERLKADKKQPRKKELNCVSKYVEKHDLCGPCGRNCNRPIRLENHNCQEAAVTAKAKEAWKKITGTYYHKRGQCKSGHWPGQKAALRRWGSLQSQLHIVTPNFWSSKLVMNHIQK